MSFKSQQSINVFYTQSQRFIERDTLEEALHLLTDDLFSMDERVVNMCDLKKKLVWPWKIKKYIHKKSWNFTLPTLYKP